MSYVLIPGARENTRIHSKQALRLLVELILLISWPGDGDNSLDCSGGANGITSVFIK